MENEESKEKPKEEANSKTRLDDMEDNIKSMKKGIESISKLLAKKLAKEDADEKDEEVKVEPEEEVDQKKEVGTTEVPVKNEGTPKPGQSNIKIPKAPVGETDETAKPEGDKGNAEFVAKVDARVMEIMKSMGITKTTTPRTQHGAVDITKNDTKKAEFAMDLLKRAKEGSLSTADMNRETKDFVKSEYERRIASVLGEDN